MSLEKWFFAFGVGLVVVIVFGVLTKLYANTINESSYKLLHTEEYVQDNVKHTVRYYCKEKLVYVHIEMDEAVNGRMILPVVWVSDDGNKIERQVECNEFDDWLRSSEVSEDNSK